MKNFRKLQMIGILSVSFLGASTGWSLETLVCGKIESTYGQHGQLETRGPGEYILKMDCNLDQKESPRDPVVEIDSFATDTEAPNAKLSDASRRGKLTTYKQKLVQQSAQMGQANPRARAPYVCMVAEITGNPCTSQNSEASIQSVNRLSGTQQIYSAWIEKFKNSNSVIGFKKKYLNAEEVATTDNEDL